MDPQYTRATHVLEAESLLLWTYFIIILRKCKIKYMYINISSCLEKRLYTFSPDQCTLINIVYFNLFSFFMNKILQQGR